MSDIQIDLIDIDIILPNDIVLYKKTEKTCYIRIPKLGDLFDIELDINSYSNISNLCIDLSDKLVAINESIGSADLINTEVIYEFYYKQMKIFINLMMEIFHSSPSYASLSIPLLRALQSIPKEIWIKADIDICFIDIIMGIYMNSSLTKDITDLAEVIIRKIIYNQSDKVYYITDFILSYIDNTELTVNQFDLLKCCVNNFHTIKYNTQLNNEITKLYREYFTTISSQSDTNIDNDYTLNEIVEIKINANWISGTIVKVNSIKNEILVEFVSDVTKSNDIISIDKNSKLVRKKKEDIINNYNLFHINYIVSSKTYCSTQKNDISNLFFPDDQHILHYKFNRSASYCNIYNGLCQHGNKLSTCKDNKNFTCNYCNGVYSDQIHWISYICSCHICLQCVHLNIHLNDDVANDILSYYKEYTTSYFRRISKYLPSFYLPYHKSLRNTRLSVTNSAIESLIGVYSFKTMIELNGNSKDIKYIYMNELLDNSDNCITISLTNFKDYYRWSIDKISVSKSFGNVLTHYYHYDCQILEVPNESTIWIPSNDTSVVDEFNNLTIDSNCKDNYEPRIIVYAINTNIEKLYFKDLIVFLLKLLEMSDSCIESEDKKLVSTFFIMLFHSQILENLKNQPISELNDNHAYIPTSNDFLFNPIKYNTIFYSLSINYLTVDLIKYLFQTITDLLIAVSFNLSDSSINLTTSIIYNIIKYFHISDSSSILINYFYNVFILKFGLKLKLFISDSLHKFTNCNNILWSKSIIDMFEEMDRLVKSCNLNLSKCLVYSENTFKSIIQTKFQDIVYKYSYKYLTNHIIGNSIYLQRIKDIISTYFNNSSCNYFSNNPNLILYRKLLKLLYVNSSSENQINIFQIHRDTVIEWAYLSFNIALDSCDSNSCNYQNNNNLVGELVDAMKRIETINCLHFNFLHNHPNDNNLIVGLTIAFRRLSIDRSYQISKAIVISISNYLDINKSNILVTNCPNQLNDIIKLSNILFNYTSIDFQYLYELLLARRLLKNTYMNISIEYNMLSRLPPMSKALRMISEIEMTNNRMNLFKHYLFRNDLNNDTNYSFCLNDNSFNVLQLSPQVWSKMIVNMTSYQNVTLPNKMKIIYDEYNSFFHYYETNRLNQSSIDSCNDSMSPKGSDNNDQLDISFYCDFYRINDIFTLDNSFQKHNNYSIRYSNHNRYHEKLLCLEYRHNEKTWTLFEYDNAAPIKILATCPIGKLIDFYYSILFVIGDLIGKYIPLHHLTYSNIWYNEKMKQINVLIASYNNENISTRRYLTWCHASGVLVLECYLPDVCYIKLTEIQAIVLLTVNNVLKDSNDLNCNVTITHLCDSINLTYNEIKEILLSLSLILELKINGQIVYKHIFLSNSLGGQSIDNPINLCSNQFSMDYSSNEANINVLRNWRNELIDASIVRYLKSTHRNKINDFIYKNNFYIYSYNLYNSIKYLLANQFKISNDEIIKRCEVLYNNSIIDKHRNQMNGLLSIGFCYKVDDASEHLSCDINLSISSRLYNQDLFDHLRLILSTNQICLTNDMFIDGIIAWISKQNTIITICPTKQLTNIQLIIKDSSKHVNTNTFYCIFKYIESTIKNVDLQLYALRSQHAYGFVNRFDDNSSIIFNLSDQLYKNLSILDNQLLNQLNRRNDGINKVKQHIYKSYFKHFPIELIYKILNQFRILVNYNQLTYNLTYRFNFPTGNDVVGKIDSINESHNQYYEYFPKLRQSLASEIDSLWYLCTHLSYKQLVMNKYNMPIEIIEYLISNFFNNKSNALDDTIEITLCNILDAYISICDPNLVDKIDSNNYITSTNINESFAVFLCNYLYKNLCKNISNLINLDLYNHLSNNNTNTSDSPTNTSDNYTNGKASDESNDIIETYLPCEFCNEIIPLHRFQDHQQHCLLGINTIASTIIDNTTSSANINTISSQSQCSNTSKENLFLIPAFDSLIMKSLIRQLLDITADIALSINQNDVSNYVSCLFYQTFQYLDIDRDGLLSNYDFIVSSPSQSEFSNHTSNSITTFNQSNDLKVNIPLNKVDSLFFSISQHKSFPLHWNNQSFMNIDEATNEINDYIVRTMDIINESLASTTSLLTHYQWNFKKLIEEYIDNPHMIRLTIGLGSKSYPSYHRFDECNNISTDNPTTSTCQICYSDTPINEIYSLTCKHWYCKICWNNYIESIVNNRDIVIRCPHPNCSYIVTIDMIELLCSASCFQLMKESIVKKYIEDRTSKHIKGSYCKNPKGCNGIVLLSDDSSFDVYCSICSYGFCISCDMTPHSPATCMQITQWEEKGGYIENGNETEISVRKCMLETTKPCPKCGVRIEKNEGCPHMTCKSCKYQYCWDCNGEFHTTTTCNRSKIANDTNPILEFEELNKESMIYYKMKSNLIDYKNNLFKHSTIYNSTYINTIFDGITVLIEVYMALANCCIVNYSMKLHKIKSLTVRTLTDNLKLLSDSLYNKITNIWKYEKFPELLAKYEIKQISDRLKEMICLITSEVNYNTKKDRILNNIKTNNKNIKSKRINNIPTSNPNVDVDTLRSETIFGYIP